MMTYRDVYEELENYAGEWAGQYDLDEMTRAVIDRWGLEGFEYRSSRFATEDEREELYDFWLGLFEDEAFQNDKEGGSDEE